MSPTQKRFLLALTSAIYQVPEAKRRELFAAWAACHEPTTLPFAREMLTAIEDGLIEEFIGEADVADDDAA